MDFEGKPKSSSEEEEERSLWWWALAHVTVVLLVGAVEEAMVGINKYKGLVNSEKMAYGWREGELGLG